MENNKNIQNKFEPIEAKFTERRDYWMKWIEGMNESLKSIDTVINLQGVVYTKRQEAVENYHSLAATIAKYSKKYKENSARLYKDIRLMKTAQGAATFMFTTESATGAELVAGKTLAHTPVRVIAGTQPIVMYRKTTDSESIRF